MLSIARYAMVWYMVWYGIYIGCCLIWKEGIRIEFVCQGQQGQEGQRAGRDQDEVARDDGDACAAAMGVCGIKDLYRGRGVGG